mmetsp:Transcript_6640/g.17986  ORF Transcript_6640/g.17986 Transcript_6640/m.17986 type:complete len:228 (-) Transcript_6640:35-718(-)
MRPPARRSSFRVLFTLSARAIATPVPSPSHGLTISSDSSTRFVIRASAMATPVLSPTPKRQASVRCRDLSVSLALGTSAPGPPAPAGRRASTSASAAMVVLLSSPPVSCKALTFWLAFKASANATPAVSPTARLSTMTDSRTPLTFSALARAMPAMSTWVPLRPRSNSRMSSITSRFSEKSLVRTRCSSARRDIVGKPAPTEEEGAPRAPRLSSPAGGGCCRDAPGP